ncbi:MULTISPECIES: RNA polymerase sigma-70 factor [unclassified Saccharicrinis]|uniref:RNA polymerase sigma-70 factor n=1 Tax=unclassified Saccharicrinis TaxID=2646859 RepID=UPI003D349B77
MIIGDKHIQKIAKGDINVFQQFFEAFYPSLCKFCFDFLKSTDVAADIAQDAMIKFWRNRETQKSIKQAKVYLYTIARNDCINQIKHNQVVEEHQFKYSENTTFILNSYIEDEVFDILESAVSKLPGQSQNIIRLALKGLKNNEIAEELDITVNTVKTLKKSAYKSLRELLKDRVFALLILYFHLFG